MTVATVPIHHVKFYRVIRLERVPLVMCRRGLQNGIVNEQYAPPVGRPDRMMTVAVVRKRTLVRSIGVDGVDILNGPWGASVRSVRVEDRRTALLLGGGDRTRQSGHSEEDANQPGHRPGEAHTRIVADFDRWFRIGLVSQGAGGPTHSHPREDTADKTIGCATGSARSRVFFTHPESINASPIGFCGAADRFLSAVFAEGRSTKT